MARSLNIEMSVMKAIGIIAVVISHRYSPYPSFFTPNSWHIPLFFFVSGYFYTLKAEADVVGYIRRRVQWLLGVYYAYHVFFAFLTLWLINHYGLVTGDIPDLYNFTIGPLIKWYPYGLGGPLWFVLQLFVTQITYLLMMKVLRRLNPSVHSLFWLFLAIGVLCTALSETTYREILWIRLLLRTGVTLFFFHLGFYYRNFWEARPIFSSKPMVGVFLLQAVLLALYRDVSYTMGFVRFQGHILLPFVVSTTGIYIAMFFSRALAKVIDERHILCRIGNATFHIAALHLSVCFVMTWILLRMHGEPLSKVEDLFYSYDLDHYWALYITLSTLIPTYMAEGFSAARAWVERQRVRHGVFIKKESF